MSRLAFGRGGPHDLGAVRDALGVAAKCAEMLETKAKPIGLPEELKAIAARLTTCPRSLHPALTAALIDEPPHLARDGGFVQPGYRPELDAALALRDDSRRVMAALEAKYVEATGIRTLKVRHNNILGTTSR